VACATLIVAVERAPPLGADLLGVSRSAPGPGVEPRTDGSQRCSDILTASPGSWAGIRRYMRDRGGRRRVLRHPRSGTDLVLKKSSAQRTLDAKDVACPHRHGAVLDGLGRAKCLFRGCLRLIDVMEQCHTVGIHTVSFFR